MSPYQAVHTTEKSGIIRLLSFFTESFRMFEKKTDESVLVTNISFETIKKEGNVSHRAILLQPKQPVKNAAGILWIHGGGYMTGMKEMVLFSRAAELVRLFGVVVLAPEYRRSIEAPYPAAIEDCYDALIYMKEHAAMLGIREDQIMVGGESAGGGLTAALCLLARDRGEVKIAYQMPLYPMLDNEDTESSRDNHGRNWDTRRNHLGWKLYLRALEGEVPSYAAAARAKDYQDLPPAYTFVGDGEPFYSETLSYIEALQKAGIEADVDVYPTDFHAFDIMHIEWDISKQAAKKFNEHFAYALEHYFAKQSKVTAEDQIVRMAKELRHTLHQNAELSMEESKTKEILMDFLKTHTKLKMEDHGSWFLAEYDCGDMAKETIAFRAEMDALPMEEYLDLPYGSINKGVSHKCGHDGQCANLVSLALSCDRFGAEQHIVFIFQPGEEIGAGAKVCAPIIKEKKIQRIYAFHNWSGFPEKSVIARKGLIHCPSMGVTFRFQGAQAHASQPEDGNNPSVAIAEFVSLVKSTMDAYKEKEGISEDPLTFGTIVGVKVGNSDFGIAPGEGEVSLTLRSSMEIHMHGICQALEELAGEISRKYDLAYQTEWSDVFPETVNDPALAKEVLDRAEEMGFMTRELEDPIRSSEDFGYFQKECPGVIFFIGNGEEYPQIHTKEYDFNDEILPTALELFEKLAHVKKLVKEER